MIDCRRSRLRANTVQRGFTLIEIMVVVVIAGIISSIVILSMGVIGDDRNLQREAYRMASLVEMAADEATLQGREFGVEILRSGYRFVEYDPFTDRWDEVIGDDLLRPRQLPDDFEFELSIEDRRVELSESAAVTRTDEDEKNRIEKYAPHALLLSSGDLTPFNLTMTRLPDNAQLQIRVLFTGEVRIGTEDADFE